MTIFRAILTAPIALAAAAFCPTEAAVVHDEATNGDLSSVQSAPTSLPFALGSNVVRGSTGRTSTTAPVDRDFFSFVISPGQALTQIILLPGTLSAGGQGISFIGLAAGSGVTDLTTATALLGWTHYSPASANRDILDDIDAGQGVAGFSRPLLAGTYTIWIQETAPSMAPYEFDFIVSEVPVPGAIYLAITGIAALADAGRRTRKHDRRSCSASVRA